MLTLDCLSRSGSPLTVLCLGSHPDDIEIGCGGTVLHLQEANPNIAFHWVVFSGDTERAREAERSVELFLARAKSYRLDLPGFRQSFFPFQGRAIKERFEALKAEVSPDIILTHYRRDLHQDHRVISRLTWNTFRDHLILEYEIPKFDGDLGTPNVFVHLDRAVGERKVQLVLDCFASQRSRQWFDGETLWAMLRLRGVESNSPGKYAEAFYGRKVVIGQDRRVAEAIDERPR